MATAEASRVPTKRPPRKPTVAIIVFALVAAAAVFWLRPSAQRLRAERQAYARQRPTFSDSSEALERTVVVPTLDTPRPEGKNVIWCSSFQLAWNEIRDNVIGAPLEVIGAEEVAKRLNEAQQSAGDLESRSYYAAGGRIRDGIIDRIEREMAAKFPSHGVPDFNDYRYPEGILAYSYLIANVPFEHPFRQLDEGLTFTDGQGVKTQVSGFGLWEAWLSAYKPLREQMEIVYLLPEDPTFPYEPIEYAIDLCKHSTPHQVVVASVEPKDSLAETVRYVERGAEQFRQQAYYDHTAHFYETDMLRVPEMFWRIDHRFDELIGKELANVDLPFMEARQTIEFRLDRSGAMLESEAVAVPGAAPRYFLFDHPFLIYMKQRDADQPFFVMWVDNAELLTRQ